MLGKLPFFVLVVLMIVTGVAVLLFVLLIVARASSEHPRTTLAGHRLFNSEEGQHLAASSYYWVCMGSSSISFTVPT